MNSNLLLAAGAAYVVTGALLLLASRFNTARPSSRSLPHHPRMLARFSAARLDARFAGFFFATGGAAYLAGQFGWNAPLSLWRLPCLAGLSLLLLWSTARLVTFRPAARRAAVRPRSSPFDTRRSLMLRRAAEREMASHIAREVSRGPRDTGVVYLRRRWDRHWWSGRLGASVEDIELAVSRVGPMRADVERFLADRQAFADTAAA